MSRLQRVNDIVNFHKGRHIDSFPLLIGGLDHRFEVGLAFLRIANGLKFFSIAKADGTLETHRAKFSTGPGNSEERSIEASASHSLRSKAIAFTQNDTEEWYTQAASSNKHTGDMPDGGSLLRFRSNHKSRCVAE